MAECESSLVTNSSVLYCFATDKIAGVIVILSIFLCYGIIHHENTGRNTTFYPSQVAGVQLVKRVFISNDMSMKHAKSQITCLIHPKEMRWLIFILTRRIVALHGPTCPLTSTTQPGGMTEIEHLHSHRPRSTFLRHQALLGQELRYAFRLRAWWKLNGFSSCTFEETVIWDGGPGIGQRENSILHA